MFDIDNFKKINDTYGHGIGDKVLVEISAIVSENVRSTDCFARWGGEEFIAVLTETDIHGAMLACEKFRKLIDAKQFPEVNHVTASFGNTQYIVGEQRDNLINLADQALYQAKHGGKNRSVSILPGDCT